MILHRIRLALLLTPSLFLPLILHSQPSGGNDFSRNVREFKRPRLTVVISIDQFRADYLRRLTDQFLPATGSDGNVGGFRYLMEQGSYFIDARYGHFPLYTGPGHAVILTGGYPYKTGIIGNEWWSEGKGRVYCVDDPRQEVVGAVTGSTAKPMGPLNLRSTTVGDELKMATGDSAKVVAIALKDRAAILLGGHMQNVCIWYDDMNGDWISSTAYCRTKKLPEWVERINDEAIPDAALGSTWNHSLSPEAMARATSFELPQKNNPYGLGKTFPHTIGAEKTRQNYRAFTLTPAANAFVFETAKRGIRAENLGADDIPDILAINLSTNDYVGHAFGPYSLEALDITVQTDRLLSDFLNFLRTTIPGGLDNVVITVTADHGVVPIPESAEDHGINTGRIEAAVEDTVQKALSARYGSDKWLSLDAKGGNSGFIDGAFIYLNTSAIERAIARDRTISAAQIEETAARAIEAIPGIYACYTRSQLLNGALPPTDITRHVAHGFYPKISGHITVVTEQMYLPEPNAGGPYITSHGTPYVYDTHVPILIAGPGIRRGIWADPVSPADIAPTLCAILGVEYPSGCDGVILKKAVQGGD